MRKTSITRVVRTLIYGLVVLVVFVAAALISLTPRLARGPTVAGAAPLVPDPEPPALDATRPSPPPPIPPAAPSTTVPTGVALSLRSGDHGAAVLDLQGRLRDLGYWLGSVDDTYGLVVEQAVTAFQKVEGLAPDGVAGHATRDALAVASRPSSSAAGDTIEVDKSRQVLFVVRDGAVAWALNTSTGTEEPYQSAGRSELADTPVGHWKVARAVDGVDVGALGALYRPRYFHPDGIAVHGYNAVPAYPASHGCVRVSDAAMDWIWAEDLMPIGSDVWVH